MFSTKKKLNHLLNYLKTIKKNDSEIGCGNGFLLKIFKLNGWKVFGTERKIQLILKMK